MVKVARMGRIKLGREPFNLTLPKDVADTTRRRSGSEHRTASALVEELLRAYFRKVGEPIVETPEDAPTKRKGAK